MVTNKNDDKGLNKLDIINDLSDGIWEWDILRDETYFSPSWKEKLGYCNSEIDDSADSWKKLVHPEDIDYVLETFYNYLNNKEKSYEVEYRIKTKSGDYKWILDRGKGTWDDNGNPIYVVGIHTDINDRKLAEEALRESEERYKTLIKYSPDPIFVHYDEKILYTNDEGAKLLGFDYSKDLIGKSIWELIPDDDVIRAKGNLEYAKIKRNDIPIREQKLKKKDGSIIYVGLSSCIIPYKGQDAILSTMRDITDNKLMKKNLVMTLKENKELLERTIEYDKLKTDFFSNISHEFKTPLNIILSSLQLIEKSQCSNKLCEKHKLLSKYINVLKQNSYRLLRLVNNLIDITRIDSKYISINMGNHDIVKIVEDITLSVAEYLKGEGINLIFDTDIEEQIIACDIDKIERIMLNLLSNAAKFTKSDGTIYVKVCYKEDNINISIRDTGIGISKEKIDIIFDRFRQVESLMTRKREGSGIGLALVKELVELHGGSIKVKSEINEGAEFIVELPNKIIKGKSESFDEIATTMDSKVDRIKIEFSDIYLEK